MIEQLWFPEFQANFEKLRKPNSRGYGGLFSLLPRNPSTSAPAFYDALRVNKGPSLGTGFTLACPYPQLTHFHELDWAESCGIPRYLIRISVGEETDLAARFVEALNSSRVVEAAVG